MPLVTNPRAAADMAGCPMAPETWETNVRLFTTAEDDAPTGDRQTLVFVKLLPLNVAAYVTLHLDLPEYREISALKKFSSKYIEVMTGVNAQASP